MTRTATQHITEHRYPFVIGRSRSKMSALRLSNLTFRGFPQSFQANTVSRSNYAMTVPSHIISSLLFINNHIIQRYISFHTDYVKKTPIYNAHACLLS